MRSSSLFGVGRVALVFERYLVACCLLLLAAGAVAGEPSMGPRVGVSDDTPIVLEGQSRCAIVHPAGEPEYAPLVARLQEAIEDASGVRIPTYADSEVMAGRFELAERFKQQNLILLGNLNENRAMVRLAANFYMYSTCEWPGTDGYELRTVTNPYGTKANCLVLAASDVRGVELAVEEFLKVVQSSAGARNLVIPRLLKVVVNGEGQELVGPVSTTLGDAMEGTYLFATVCEGYNRTGSPERLQVVRDMIESLLEAGRAPVAEDYGTEAAVRGLDLVDTLVMTPEENQKMDNALLHWVLDVLRERPYWNPLGRQWSFGGHQACGALSFYVAVDYLLRNGNPNDAARELLEQKRAESRQFLSYATTSFKDADKDVGWESWTPLTVLPRYAMAEGDMTFFDSGTAANVVRRHFYADHGFGPAAIVSFVFNDGEFKSLQPEGGHMGGWAFVMGGARWVTPPSLESLRPEFLIGTKVMESSRTDWENAFREREKGTADWYTHVPWEKTFHLVGFVEGMDGDDQFAVLGGWDSIRAPGEANSLRVFRQGGHRFLFRADGDDQRRPRPGRFYQNTVVVNSGGYDIPPPCGAELLAHHDGPDVGMVAGRLSDFGGADWERCVFWRRGKYFAFLDTCAALKDGPIVLANQWWNSDAPGLQGDSWVAHTGKGAFRLVMADAGTVSSRQWWDGGPYQLRQSKFVEARRGQRVSFYNAFYVDSPGTRQSYQIRKAGAEAMMIRGCEGSENAEEIALMGRGSQDAPARYGSLSVKAPLFFVSHGAVALEPTDELTVDGRKIQITPGSPLDSTDARLLKTTLEKLWDSLPPRVEAAAAVAPDADSSIHLCGLTERILVAETDYAQITGVAFTRDSDETLTWDLGRDIKVTRIDGVRIDSEQATVSCSSDGFKNDVRTVNVEKGERNHWVMYQYGWAAVLGQGTLSPVNEVARYFRIGVPSDKVSYGLRISKAWQGQNWNVTGHNPELFNRPFWQDVIFRGEEPQVQFTRTMAADLDGDGAEEVIASTDNDELLVLNADGKLRWKHRFDGPVLNLICEDMEADGRREVIAACFDNSVYCFEHGGELRFKLDLLAESTLHAPANSLCVYDAGDGRRGLVLPTYDRCLKYDQDGNFVTEINAPGFYEDTALPVAEDFNGDGVPDFVMRENVWGIVSLIDGKEFKSVATADTGYIGEGLAAVPWAIGGDKTNAVLVIARQGVAMLSVGKGVGKSSGGDALQMAGGIAPVFSLPISPITGWDVADVGGDGEREIVLGTLYGSVVVLNDQGKIASSQLAGPEVADVAVIRSADGTARIMVSTGSALSLYDAGMKLLSRQPVEGPGCVKIQRLSDRGLSRAMCFFKDGTVSVVACD